MIYSNFKRVLITLGTIFALTLNLLANLLPINNLTTAELSDKYAVYFVPAGYVFSIWGVIYLFLIAYAILQITQKSEKFQKVFNAIFPFHLAGLILNGVWILFWHYEQVEVSVLIMLGLLASLILTYLKINKSKLEKGYKSKIVKATFSIYLGWISVATIANITVALFKNGVTEFIFNGQIWASILILIAGVLASIFIFRKDYFYPAVIIWAIVGIAIKFSSVNIINIAIITAIFLMFATWSWKNIGKK